MLKRFTNLTCSFILPAILFLTVFSACSKSDHADPVNTNIDTLSIKYLVNDDLSFTVFRDSLIMPIIYPPQPTTVFSYQNGKVVKRTGGLLSPPSEYIYSLSVYDTVMYSGNTITLLTKSSDASITVDPHQRVLLLNNDRIIQQTTATDTTYYYYTDGLLSHTETTSYTQQLSRKFTFNGGNLQLIESTCVWRTSRDTVYKQVEDFTNYDTKTNGLKQFGIWNDLFYRSLSHNNFKVTTINKFANDGSHSYSDFQSPISYQDGQPNYSR